jgi:hypothetical protein
MINTYFLGDISLNDNYRKLNYNPFKDISMEMVSKDYIIGNLESISKGNLGENELKKPRLTTDPKTLNFLSDIKLDIACLAQNHVFDHLEDGFNQTVKALEEQNIKYFGAGNSSNYKTDYIISKNDINIGLLNYVTLDTNPGVPESSEIKVNIFDVQNVKNKIEEIKNKVHHIVVILHWGGKVEGGSYPDLNQPKIAKELIDYGADLIIGHHSHTIQPYEIYKGKNIYYSLGNFCFDDINFEGRLYPLSPERKKGLILNIKFFKSSYEIKHVFIKNENLTISKDVKGHIEYKKLVKKYNLLFKHKVFWKIYFINLKKIRPFRLFLIRKDITLSDKINRIIKSFLKKIN